MSPPAIESKLSGYRFQILGHSELLYVAHHILGLLSWRNSANLRFLLAGVAFICERKNISQRLSQNFQIFSLEITTKTFMFAFGTFEKPILL